MRANPIEAILESYPVIVLDGGLATELERSGFDLNDSLWSAKILLEAPEAIAQVHADYFRAGADIVITASYQASVQGFARKGLSDDQALGLIKQSAQLAASARDGFWSDPGVWPSRPRPLVAGSIGPYGAFLADGSEYRGDYALDQQGLAAFHRPRMQALIAAGADLLACETLPSLFEAKALLQLLETFPETVAWFSFSCRDHSRISNGDWLADAAACLDGHPQVAAIGINCTAPCFVPELIRAAAGATSRPIIVYPNSGETWDAASRTWRGKTSPQAFAKSARHWYDCGARIIGGCCRTTPADIGAVARWARRLKIP
jgi:homocysteine S-methyltransferase